MKNVLGILFLVISLPTYGWSITYYVSTSGADSNAGTSASTPWKSISKVNNTQSFSPGDSILFKRGDTFTEKLIIRSSGNAENNIVFGAYGKGVKPIIDVKKSASAAITCFQSYITFQDLILKNSTGNALGIAHNEGANNMRIYRLEIFNSGNNGIGFSKGGNNIHIDSCRIINSTNNGIFLSGSPDNKLSHVVVENTFVSGVTTNDGITIHEDSSRNSAGSDFLLQNNYAENCHEQGFDITTGSEVLLLNNKSKNNGQGGVVVGHSAKNVTIQNHHSIDEPVQNTSAAINIGGDSSGWVTLLYSVIEGDGYHLLLITRSNVKIYNNTFVWNGGGSIFDMAGPTQNIAVKNNIFTTRQDSIGRIRFLDPSRAPDDADYTFDNNIYYAPNGLLFHVAAKGRNYDFAKFRATFGHAKFSIALDPLLENKASRNYRLTQSSPAINAGENLAFAKDFSGNPVPHGPKPDIGAYEFSAVPTADLSDKNSGEVAPKNKATESKEKK